MPELLPILADGTANYEQIGPKQRMQSSKIVVDACAPARPIEAFLGAYTGRGGELGIAAVKFQVSELGVGQQTPVEEYPRADACAEGQQHDHAAHSPTRPGADLGNARRIRIVDEDDRSADELCQLLAAPAANPGLIDIGRCARCAPLHHRWKGQAHRTGARELAINLRTGPQYALGRRR